MVYTEIKQKGKNNYYYRVISIRKGKKVSKKRIYLGKNLNKKILKEKEEEANKELKLLSTLLNSEELKLLKSIQENYLKEPKENLENRYESFCSLFAYNSTNIEGNTLTLQETSNLLFDKITPNKSLREINEVINHKEAFDFILDYKGDLTKQFILKLHEIVVKNTLKSELSDNIGKYRNLQVYIRGTSWLPPKPKQVPKEMGSLLRWYAKNKKELHPLILTAYFHSAFETIHPFVDGNGRVGRLILNFILHKNNFPMINILNKDKYDYYSALESSQTKGDLRKFIELLIKLLKDEKIKF
jgi:Fic family protein